MAVEGNVEPFLELFHTRVVKASAQAAHFRLSPAASA
jgi:hypothetical protein